MKSRQKGLLWVMWTILSGLLLIGIVALLLSSCTTFEKAKRKFATEVADTTYTTMTTTIPRDSVHLVVKTDTTRIIERMRQGRATVTIIREPTNTTIIANCDSLTATKKVAVKIVTQKWGVDPAYKTSSDRWRTVTLVLLALVGVAVIGYFVSQRFLISASITRR